MCNIVKVLSIKIYHIITFRWKLDITLSDGVITWTQKPDGQSMSVPVDKERLLGALKRQVQTE